MQSKHYERKVIDTHQKEDKEFTSSSASNFDMSVICKICYISYNKIDQLTQQANLILYFSSVGLFRAVLTC